MSYLDTYYNSISQSDRDRAIETNSAVIDIQRHSHAGSRLYPKFADSILLTAGAGDYEEGSAVEIVPNNAINTEWDIHDVFASTVSNFDLDYVITFYQNGTSTPRAESVIRLSSAVSGTNTSYAKSDPIPANVGVYAKVAVQGGLSRTISIRILWDFTGAA
jgi:hypothetical protein